MSPEFRPLDRLDRTARPAHADLPANEGATSYHGGKMALNQRKRHAAFPGLQGLFLYYKVLGVDPNPDASTAQEEEAISVDVITRRQRKEFLAQERLVFDESIGSAFKAEVSQAEEPVEPAERQAPSESTPDAVRKNFRARIARTAIKYSKAPSGVYGMQELQMALYELLCTMAAPNYSSTVGGVSPTSPTCGTDLLRLLNAAISPTGSVTNKNAKRAYDTHKDSFTDKTNFMTWWPMLLIL